MSLDYKYSVESNETENGLKTVGPSRVATRFHFINAVSGNGRTLLDTYGANKAILPVEQGPVDVSMETSWTVHEGSLNYKKCASMVETKITPSDVGRKVDVSVLQKCLSVILKVYTIFGFKTEGAYNMSGSLRHWMGLCEAVGGEEAWLPVCKYKLAAFFSCCAGQPLPKAPFPAEMDHPGVLLGGRATRWTRLFMTKATEVAGLEFLASILMCKRGMPKVSKKALQNAEVETILALTTARKVAKYVGLHSWADISDFPERKNDLVYATQADVLGEIRRRVEELFDGVEYTQEDRVRPFFPSTSAGFSSSRMNGGSIGLLLRDPELLDGLRGRSTIKWSKRYHSGESDVRDEKEEEGHLGDSRNGREEEHMDENGYAVDMTGLEEKFSILYRRILRKAEGQVPSVSPVALPEALKIRVITKGPEYLYMAMKPIQKKLWTVLKSHPTFQLIGKPIDASIVSKIMGKLRDDQLFLSGDYKSATDRLHSWISEAIAREVAICLKLSELETRLLIRSLTQHMFDGKPQLTGQLMGSITSFPILCIANAVLTAMALEQDTGRRSTLRRLPLLINGDDVVCKTTKRGAEFWRKLTTFGGLEESVGKTYYSRKFLCMNSTFFSYKPLLKAPVEQPLDLVGRVLAIKAGLEPASGHVVDENRFQQIGFVNSGLFYGVTRSGASVGMKDAADPEWSLGARARDLINTAPRHLSDTLMTMYVEQHRVLLEKIRVPWYMPERLGGLGLPSFFNSRFNFYCGPTIVDIRKGADIHWNKLDRVRRGSPSSWKVDSLVDTLLPQRPVELSTPDYEAYNRVYGALVVSLLFMKTELNDLLKQQQSEHPGLKNLRSNERLWRRATPIPWERCRHLRELIVLPRKNELLGIPISSIKTSA